MSEQHINTGNVSGQNANVGGTQNFYGTVYFGSYPIEAAPMHKNRIFLSYARGDDHPDYHDATQSFICRLYTDLKTEHDLWWDRADMPSRGLSFLPEIRDAVAECSRLILVVGEHALKSDYVRAEWEYALSRCIPVIPILRNGDYSLIPAAVQLLHTPDFRDDQHYDKSLADLKRILGEPDAPLGTLFGVPSLPENYIEREVLDEVRGKLLADSNAPLVVTSAREQTVTVHGVGGIGKTTLSAALARHCDVRRSFPDGIFFIEIGKTPDLLARMADVGAMFGDARQEYADSAHASQRLSAVLANKRALLVLDDVWNQAHAKVFQVADARCRLLITTRQGGIVTQLQAQGAPLATLTLDEGLRLIAERMNTTPATLPDACRAIIQLVDGHTLAVSLAAAILEERGMEYAERLLQRLQSGKYFDKTLQLAQDDKNLNLELCLRLSYDDLSADLQRRFRALGVLALGATFDERLAQALWRDEDADTTDDALTDLVRAGLLRREKDNQYSQHGLLRAYAAALLNDANETDMTFRRYAEYITDIAEKFWDLSPEEWTQLDNDIPHIQHIGDTLVTLFEAQNNLTELALQFADNTTNYVFRRPEIHRLNWLEMGLATSRKATSKKREKLFLNQLGLYFDSRGDKRQALNYYEQKPPIDRELGDKSGEAITLSNIGMVWSALGEKYKALDYYNQALPIQQQIGDKSGEATTLNNIGAVWDDMGEKHKALDYYHQALLLVKEIGHRQHIAGALNNIGSVWDDLGEKYKALDYYNQALPIRRAVGDKSGEATTLSNIGKVWDDLGEKHKALDYYNQALPIQQQVGDKSGEATTLNNIGKVYSDLGEKHKALDYYNQTLPIRRVVGDKSGEATTLNNIGLVWSDLGEKHKALDYYNQALPILRQVGNRSVEATTCFNMGILYYNEGNLDEAIRYLEHCVELEEQTQHPDFEDDRQLLARWKQERDQQNSE